MHACMCVCMNTYMCMYSKCSCTCMFIFLCCSVFWYLLFGTVYPSSSLHYRLCTTYPSVFWRVLKPFGQLVYTIDCVHTCLYV